MITKEKFANLIKASWRYEILFWIKDNKLKTEKGNLIEFENHKFLQDIYEDWTPVQVSRKGSQIGYSTMQIIKSLWAALYVPCYPFQLSVEGVGVNTLS